MGIGRLKGRRLFACLRPPLALAHGDGREPKARRRRLPTTEEVKVMHVSHESQKERYPDVLAGIVRQLHDDHQVLLNSLMEAEQTLLGDLRQPQKQTFWRYKELLDELHALYQDAAYEAGRKAGTDVSTEALQEVIQVLRGLVTTRAKTSREP
jgi:hypothetical protein